MLRAHLSAAVRDVAQGIAAVPIWATLGWQEIRQRYRRSTLGPFWLTISTGAMVAAMGPLYGRLLNQDVTEYFPYLAVSLVVWQFLAALTTESCLAFIAAESYVKNIKLPLTVHVMRVMWRNTIVFAHNLVIVAIVFIVFTPAIGWHLAEIPVAIALIAVNAIWVGLMLGMVCARFRDIPQIVSSLVQVAFFLTPVLWHAGMLGRNLWAVKINPYYYFLEIVRQPVFGASAGVQSWAIVLGITILGCAGTLLFFARFRTRVAYWV
jgi:ABC-type polysaccharide/polyol phosphate export permease